MLIRKLKVAEPEAVETPVLTAMDRTIAPRLITRERAMAAGAAVLVLMLGVYGYVHFGLTRAVAVEAERITVAAVQRGVFHDYIPLTGNVVPRTTVYLDAVAGGQVSEALVEEGATVTAGQSLVVLKNANLELEVMGREASLAEQLYQLTTTRQSLDERRLQRARDLAEIDYQIATLKAQLDRKRPLQAQGYATRNEIEDMERSLTRYQRTYASVREAQDIDSAARPQQIAQIQQSIDLLTSNLAMAHKNLDALTIRAPIAGQLSMLDAESGAAKSPGQRIGQIDSAEGFKVRANVDEFYLARVAAGQRASADLDGQTLALTVAKVYPGVKDRQFAVDLAFDAQPPAIRRGQTLHLKLEIGEAGESLMVANGAFYDDAGGQWVFALNAGGTAAEHRAVTLGRRNPENVEVLGGLNAGERIVTSSYTPYLKYDRIDIHGGEAKP